jgi:beta-xylosidase
VAVGDRPEGPFRDGVRIEGPAQIDPNIFVDDNGQAYYFWGQFSAKGAKMNPDLKTLDLSTMRDSILTERAHGFHEGSYVIKRGEWYYYLFADISRNHRPTCLGYAMAKDPFGPYEYKGVVIDNAGCDPEVWNNHGSLVQFGDRWYVLYHRSTHGSRTMRKACIEPIRFNADGTIDEVEMTSQGAGARWKPSPRSMRPVPAASGGM